MARHPPFFCPKAESEILPQHRYFCGLKRTTMVLISDEILAGLQISEAEFRLEMALWLFSARKISFGAARKWAGMDVWQFQELLDDRGIAAHYDVEEYLADLKTLQILSH